MNVAVSDRQLLWFVNEVVGKPEGSFLVSRTRTTDPQGLVRILGTLRLGLPHRDVDLFTLGVEQSGPLMCPAYEGLVCETMTFTSQVTGAVRTLQKLKGKTAEGRTVTLMANPFHWWRDQDTEYTVACDLLQDDVMHALYMRLRAEGRKMEAYHLLGVKMSGERA